MREISGHNDIVEARKFIYEQMVKLSNHEISLDEGVVQAKLAHQLMEGYKAQVRFIEATGGLSSIEDIKKITKAIENKNV